MDLSEAEELELLELENENARAQMKDAPSDQKGGGIKDALVGGLKYGPIGLLPEGRNFAGDATDALLNRPAREGAYKSAQMVGKYGIPTALSMAVPGIAPAVRGAGLAANALRIGAGAAQQGAAVSAGSLLQSGIQQGARALGDETIPAQSLSDATKQAAASGFGAAAGTGLLGAGHTALTSDPAIKAGSQLLRIATNVPEKFGKAVLNDPEIFSRAGKAVTRAAYQTFEDASGLMSPRLARALGGKMTEAPAGAQAAIDAAAEKLTPYIDQAASRTAGKIIYDTERIAADFQSGALGKEVQQLLYNGSQGASYLQKLAKAGKPEEAANFANIGNAKDTFDDLLERLTPGYGKARTASFEEATADAFDSAFPLNNNQSPNALRGWAGVQTALAAPLVALTTGSPYPLLGMLAPFAQSPLVAKGVIRGVNALSKSGAAGAASKAGVIALTSKSGQVNP